MSLRAKALKYAYDGLHWVVQDVTAEIRPGELLGIIGPNGSGKSTLLRLVAGLLTPASGSVFLDDTPIRSIPPARLARRIAFLPQLVQPAFAFTCEEVVAQGRYPYLHALGFLSRMDVEVVRNSMALTDTLEFTERSFDELSGGERQRVLIASILAQEADHLLLDEPTAALDIHHQARVFEHLWEFSRRAMAVAVVVHDLNLAAQFCDRLLLMSAGRIVAEGGAREVLRVEHLAPVYGGNVAVGENTLTGGPLVTVLTEGTRAGDSG
jgi:iron complex transport system ATP-binding protein